MQKDWVQRGEAAAQRLGEVETQLRATLVVLPRAEKNRHRESPSATAFPHQHNAARSH